MKREELEPLVVQLYPGPPKNRADCWWYDTNIEAYCKYYDEDIQGYKEVTVRMNSDHGSCSANKRKRLETQAAQPFKGPKQKSSGGKGKQKKKAAQPSKGRKRKSKGTKGKQVPLSKTVGHQDYERHPSNGNGRATRQRAKVAKAAAVVEQPTKEQAICGDMLGTGRNIQLKLHQLIKVAEQYVPCVKEVQVKKLKFCSDQHANCHKILWAGPDHVFLDEQVPLYNFYTNSALPALRTHWSFPCTFQSHKAAQAHLMVYLLFFGSDYDPNAEPNRWVLDNMNQGKCQYCTMYLHVEGLKAGGMQPSVLWYIYWWKHEFYLSNESFNGLLRKKNYLCSALDPQVVLRWKVWDPKKQRQGKVWKYQRRCTFNGKSADTDRWTVKYRVGGRVVYEDVTSEKVHQLRKNYLLLSGKSSLSKTIVVDDLDLNLEELSDDSDSFDDECQDQAGSAIIEGSLEYWCPDRHQFCGLPGSHDDAMEEAGVGSAIIEGSLEHLSPDRLCNRFRLSCDHVSYQAGSAIIKGSLEHLSPDHLHDRCKVCRDNVNDQDQAGNAIIEGSLEHLSPNGHHQRFSLMAMATIVTIAMAALKKMKAVWKKTKM